MSISRSPAFYVGIVGVLVGFLFIQELFLEDRTHSMNTYNASAQGNTVQYLESEWNKNSEDHTTTLKDKTFSDYESAFEYGNSSNQTYNIEGIFDKDGDCQGYKVVFQYNALE